MDMHYPCILAAVEGGGTSFKVAITQLASASSDPKILHTAEMESRHDQPKKTLEECAAFLQQHKPPGGYHALGIACFGPLGVDPGRPDEYGRILPGSPKAAWRRVDLLTPLRDACQDTGRPLAVKVETDVNAPALAEYLHWRRQHKHDKSKQISSLAYITVGTGVGVGLVMNDLPVHGRMHPEGGHMPVVPLEGDNFVGNSWGVERSPFRGKNTVEGLASSVSLTERLQQMQGKTLERSVLSQLPDDHELWDHAANALANCCATLLLLSVERIVLGGGVMKRKCILKKIREQTVVLLNNYLELPKDMTDLITTSQSGDDAGLMGAIVLSQRAHQEQQDQGGKRLHGEKAEYWSSFLSGVVVSASVALLLFRVMSNRSSK